MDKVKGIVKEILEEDPYSRNSDIWLLLSVWKRQGADFYIKTPLNKLFNPESVRRCRQLIQAKGEYPPTDPEIIKKRNIREKEIRKWVMS